MSILNIQPVKSGQSKAIIALAGTSGSGKTLTALYIARGMVNNASEIGFLDTENKRGSLYHDALDGKFMIGDLYAPFSPNRYAEAIKEFQDAGVKVLVIDSVSHEHSGIGGLDDIANMPKADGNARKIADWKTAKHQHKAFMNALLYSNIDIICCIRAQEKTDFTDVTKPKSLGIQPICEKNFMFEMTASVMMSNNGKNQKHIKVPNFLIDIFGNGNDYLGIETGKKIKKYFTSVEQDSEEIKKLKTKFLLTCEKGTTETELLWNTLTSKQKNELKDELPVYKASALAYDKILEEVKNENLTEFEQEQKRIKVFIENAKDINSLLQFDNLELSDENFKLLNAKKTELNG